VRYSDIVLIIAYDYARPLFDLGGRRARLIPRERLGRYGKVVEDGS